MFSIAGQTVEPNWHPFFEGTHGYPGAKRNFKTFSSKIIFFSKFKF